MKSKHNLKTIFSSILLLGFFLLSCNSDNDSTEEIMVKNIEVEIRHRSDNIDLFSGGTIISVSKSDMAKYDPKDYSLVTENDGNIMLTKSNDILSENYLFKWQQTSSKLQVVHTVNISDDIVDEDLNNINLELDIIIRIDGIQKAKQSFKFNPEQPNTFIISNN